VTCTNTAGEPVKKATVEARYASTGKAILSMQTDEIGRVKLSLPGNASYTIVVTLDDFKSEKTIDLQLKQQGETVIKHEVVITE
jgi:hypothetical protein